MSELLRALGADDLPAVRAAAAAQGHVELVDAAAIVALIAQQEPRRFQAAAVRWIARYATERRAGLDKVAYASRLLQALGSGHHAALGELVRLAVQTPPRDRPTRPGVSADRPAVPVLRRAHTVAWRAAEPAVYDPDAHCYHRPGCPRAPQTAEALGAGEVRRFEWAPGSCPACGVRLEIALTGSDTAPGPGLPPAASPPSKRRTAAVRGRRMPPTR